MAAIEESGLDVVVTPLRGGRVQLELVTGDGTVVYTNQYKNQASARASASFWVKKHYAVDVREVPATLPAIPEPEPKPKAKPKSTGPLENMPNLVKKLTAQADRYEVEVFTLREKAEKMELDAKRLRAAIDALTEGEDLG